MFFTIWRELALFAGVGFLLFGLDDLLVDLVWLGFGRKDSVLPLEEGQRADSKAIPTYGIAIFVPAWDESAVIGAMIDCCMRQWGGQDFRIYIGSYANDPATALAVKAKISDQVRLVTTVHHGPTTKADCLNAIWAQFRLDTDNSTRPWAIVLHDAEDCVHRQELRLYRALLPHHAMVQLPVLPLPDARSHWIAGHYIDEFAEAHGKDLIVRSLIGASLPSAGVGCAIRADTLAKLAQSTGGKPFDENTLTEDYELGLRLAALGQPGHFARCRDPETGTLIAVRAYFPNRLVAAVRQKTRWIIGIALAGWDRTGWSRNAAEVWMRWRDRRTILAAILLLAGYASMVAALPLIVRGTMPLPDSPLVILFSCNFLLLCWRLSMRATMVGREYGWRQSLHAVPRALVTSILAIMASRRAFAQYLAMLRTGTLHWDKTRHEFPDQGQI